MPNRDCLTWRLFDAQGSNPYWAELEHFHNFSHRGLVALLRATGFTALHYGVSERYRSCMEVIARKEDVQVEPGLDSRRDLGQPLATTSASAQQGMS